MRVLIVDDSIVYRSKIRAALANQPGIEIVGAASNGQTALELIAQQAVDLVTLDMEMPVMDGLQTLKTLRKTDRKTKVLVFSSSTVRGSEATLEALASGADDFVAKPSGEDTGVPPEEAIRRELLPKILQFVRREASAAPTAARSTVPAPAVATPAPRASLSVPAGQRDVATFRPEVIVIASSTGGPTAHETIFSAMGGQLRIPILIAQHMPPVFTTSFAKRIGDYSGLPCQEAVAGEPLQNKIYVAPGDFHLVLEKRGTQIFTGLTKLTARNSVRPAADYLFETAVSIYGARCMGFVLTGMGEDGLAGTRAVKASGGGIMIQDEASCVVFGMPGAVFAAKTFDAVGNLQEIRKEIMRMALT